MFNLAFTRQGIKLLLHVVRNIDLVLNGGPLLLNLLQLRQLLVDFDLLLDLLLLLQLYLLLGPASLGTHFEQVMTVSFAHAHCSTLLEDAGNFGVQAHQHVLLILDLGVTLSDLIVYPVLKWLPHNSVDDITEV